MQAVVHGRHQTGRRRKPNSQLQSGCRRCWLGWSAAPSSLSSAPSSAASQGSNRNTRHMSQQANMWSTRLKDHDGEQDKEWSKTERRKKGEDAIWSDQTTIFVFHFSEKTGEPRHTSTAGRSKSRFQSTKTLIAERTLQSGHQETNVCSTHDFFAQIFYIPCASWCRRGSSSRSGTGNRCPRRSTGGSIA